MLETQITQLDSSQLDNLFENIPDTTPNADTLSIGKDNPDNKEVVVTKSDNNIPYIENFDDLENIDTEEENEDTEEKDTKEEKKEETEEKDTKEEDKEEINVSAVNEVLKNTVDYLVSSGQWVDFEGREDIEITQEVYAELVAKQDEHRVTSMFSELLDSTGDYGKAIISHIKAGGNPDEIIDLFKEQKQIEQLDTSTEKGKQQLVEKYYSEVLGWKTEKVEKTVNRLIEDNEIDNEFTDVKELYDSHYQKKLDEIQESTREQERITKQKQVTFVNNIKTALQEETEISPKDKALIASSILDFKHQLDNGQKVNDFYLKFAEMQSDPKQYIKLVRFVMNPEGFQKQIEKKEESKAAAKTFNFIKGNSALNKNKSASIEINENPKKQVKGTDFSFVIQK